MNPPAPKADACNKKDKAGCTDTCAWQSSYNYDEDTKKCIDESKCITKPVHDPKDPFGLKQQCPDMTDAQKDTCDKKADFQAKLDCFMPICPHMVGILSYMTCMSPKDAASCTKAAPICAWDVNKNPQCGIDVLKLYGSMIPDTCPLKPVFLNGMTCGMDDRKTKAACEKDTKCKWATMSECDGQGATQSREGCDTAETDMFSGMIKDIFGAKLDAQVKKCEAAKAQAACDGVEADKGLVGGGGGGNSGGGATTIADMGTVPAISTFTTFLVGFLVAP